jgi:N-acetylglucosaminyl-diphospho-decaprenol L-rhamnosyltransferase
MHVALLIVGFRNVEDILRCLAAVAHSTHADFEVVVCENGGGEAFRALAAAAPARLAGGQPVRIIEAPGNLGYAGGVNFALAATPGADAWWVLNPDTEVEPSALSAMLARLDLGDCDAVGGRIYMPDRIVQSCGGRWWAWFARSVSLCNGDSLDGEVDGAAVERSLSYISGACMLFGRRFLEVTGPMREDYFLYCEEVEWCLRARSKGMHLGFAPAARVMHYPGGTTGSADAIRTRPRTPIFLDERNKMLVTRDCFPARLPVAALSALMLLICRFGREAAWEQLGYALSGWAAGVANRRGVPAWIEAPGNRSGSSRNSQELRS